MELHSIVFRTHADIATGIGHLVRCVNLAHELVHNGQQCVFVLDYPVEAIKPFLGDFVCFYLYEGHQELLVVDEDAEGFLKLLEEHSFCRSSWVVVDDYRLGVAWETRVRGQGYKLAVLDDLLRSHHCDLLIDSRWRGKRTMSLYDSLVPTNSQKLLGPSYTIMYPEYKSYTESQKKKDPQTPFVLMIGFGGGGTKYRFTVELIERIVGNALELDRPILIYLIIGPLSEKRADMERFSNSLDNVIPLIGKTNIYKYLCETDLYIGAAGGILYQLVMHQIPAVTFSISENQDNCIFNLEAIGHFFHCNTLVSEDLKELAELALVLVQNYRRISELYSAAQIKVDGQGSSRIAQSMLHGGRQSSYFGTGCDLVAVEEEKLSQQHTVRAVTDRDINHYLMCRNLKENRMNMTEEDEISPLQHYLWWFKHKKRESFVVLRDGIPCIYIWHQLIQRNDMDFLIGGWFVCKEDISFAEALLGLQWQLEYCDSFFPNVQWLAVISRKNKFVNLLNKYLGFSELSAEHPYCPILADLFKKASRDRFYYVLR